MPLYLFSSQIPEPKHLPSLGWGEIIEGAVFSLPINVRGFLTFAGIAHPLAVLDFRLFLVLGRWAAEAPLLRQLGRVPEPGP